MTTRIALIGNSHAAAFKSAWDEMAVEHPQVEITFFAVRNQGRVGIDRLEVQNGKLAPGDDRLTEGLKLSSGGLGAIDPALYDAYLLVGFPPRMIALPPRSPYSDAVRTAMYDAAREAPALTRMRANIRAVAPGAPVFAAAQPLFATPPKSARFCCESYAAAATVMADRVFTPLGIGFLPQPCATILDDQWTDPLFSRGSVRLPNSIDAPETDPHPADDRTHMNAAYGALALAEAIPEIKTALG